MTTLLEEVKDGIAVLTLHRPDKLNALDYALIDALAAALDDLEADPAVRAVILTGAGDRAFSAGADIAEFAGSIEAGLERALRDFVRRGQRLTRQIECYAKPLIAAVNGIAFGAGCEITEAAPLALASDRARFAKPEIRLGFPPPFGGTQRLPRLIGRSRAIRLPPWPPACAASPEASTSPSTRAWPSRRCSSARWCPRPMSAARSRRSCLGANEVSAGPLPSWRSAGRAVLVRSS